MDEGTLPDTIESPATFDSTLADGNIFFRATSHLARADSGILQQRPECLPNTIQCAPSCVILQHLNKVS